MILFSSQIIHGKVQGGMGLGQDGKGLVWGRDMGQVRGGRLGRGHDKVRGLGGGQAWGHDKVLNELVSNCQALVDLDFQFWLQDI